MEISTTSGSSLLESLYIVKMISQHLQYVDIKNLKEIYKHLGNVQFQLMDDPIDLLIGQDRRSPLSLLEAKYGKKDESNVGRTNI